MNWDKDGRYHSFNVIAWDSIKLPIHCVKWSPVVADTFPSRSASAECGMTPYLGWPTEAWKHRRRQAWRNLEQLELRVVIHGALVLVDAELRGVHTRVLGGEADLHPDGVVCAVGGYNANAAVLVHLKKNNNFNKPTTIICDRLKSIQLYRDCVIKIERTTVVLFVMQLQKTEVKPSIQHKLKMQ